jgi:hypothetical protein
MKLKRRRIFLDAQGRDGFQVRRRALVLQTSSLLRRARPDEVECEK